MVSRLLQSDEGPLRRRPCARGRSTSREGLGLHIKDIAWLSPTSIVVLHPIGGPALPGPHRLRRRRTRRHRRPVGDPRGPDHRPGRHPEPRAEHVRADTDQPDRPVRPVRRRHRHRAGRSPASATSGSPQGARRCACVARRYGVGWAPCPRCSRRRPTCCSAGAAWAAGSPGRPLCAALSRRPARHRLPRPGPTRCPTGLAPALGVRGVRRGRPSHGARAQGATDARTGPAAVGACWPPPPARRHRTDPVVLVPVPSRTSTRPRPRARPDVRDHPPGRPAAVGLAGGTSWSPGCSRCARESSTSRASTPPSVRPTWPAR